MADAEIRPCVDAQTLAEAVKGRAHTLGFEMVGITDVRPSLFREEYRAWLDKGYAGEMHYLARDPERRLDPGQLLPDARSLIVVGMNYYADGEEGPGTPERPDGTGLIARYARGDDYHDVMTARLKTLLAFLCEQAGPEATGRVYVDTGPILEREVAQRAGLGWFGKNTLLINTRRGSYFFLGEIVTNVALTPDSPAVGGCGTCRKCLDACPTGAIVRPYEIDARRCLSYLTIENKGAIPDEFQPALAATGRIYGCDICQEVCPFNARRATPTDEPAFQSRPINNSPRLTALLALDDEGFRREYRGSPIKRAKRRGLLRNVAVAAVPVTSDGEANTALQDALHDPEPLVREQATNTLRRTEPSSAQGATQESK